MSEPFKLLWGDKVCLQAFLALFNKIFGVRLAPAIAMMSVCQAQGRSYYKAVTHSTRGPNVVVCNFRTRQPRRSFSPRECRWETNIKIASVHGYGMLTATSFFPSVFSSAYYVGRNHSDVMAQGDTDFLKVLASIKSVMDQLPMWSSVEDFAEAMHGTVREDIGQKDITF